MECIKTKKQVLVKDCEYCLTERNCLPICFKRGFVWGTPDNKEPLWMLSIPQAKKSKEDISVFYQKHNEIEIKVIVKSKEIIPSEIRWVIWERDNFTCKICGSRKYLSIDHIIPESKGGKLIESNLQTLCKSCNSRKGARL
jgi:hypothetical protein